MTNANRKPVKGDTIYVASIWEPGIDATYRGQVGAPTIAIRKLIVRSFGKVQGTFSDPETGEMIGRAAFTRIFTYAFDPADLAPEIERLRGLIADRIAGSIRISENWIDSHVGLAGPEIMQRAREGLEAARATAKVPVAVVDYRDAHAAVLADVARTMAPGSPQGPDAVPIVPAPAFALVSAVATLATMGRLFA